MSQHLGLKVYKDWASACSTVVQHSGSNPKVKGSNPTRTGIEKNGAKMLKLGKLNERYGMIIKQHSLRNVSDCLNTNIYSYLEPSGGQSYNLYLKVIPFLNTSVNYASVAA
jgi:hypothetical protein